MKRFRTFVTVKRNHRICLPHSAARELMVLVFAFWVAIMIFPAAALAQKPAAKGVPKQSQRNLNPHQLDLDVLFEDLGPVASGTGIVILEPVAAGVDDGSAAFGAGCSRWLQFMVAGHGELGKTPSWGSIDQVRKSRGWPNLRLSQAQAVGLGNALGVTHVVTAELKGSPTNLTLEYQVVFLRDKHSISALTLSGDDTHITQALPGAAVKIARALGVAEPRVPQSCAAGANGLAAMGKVAWMPTEETPPEDLKELREAAKLDPAAAVLSLSAAGVPDPKAADAARQTLNRLGSRNVIAQHVIVATARQAISAGSADAQALAEKYPANYLVTATQLRFAEFGKQTKHALELARRGVQCAPHNSRAWYRLGTAYSASAESIRRSRVIADMTRNELDAVSELYLYWVAAAKKAVDLDTQFPEGWLGLSTAAAFLGEEELADAAYTKALALDSDDYKILWWGLEMYQPKWLDNRNKLDHVVNVAVQAKYANPLLGVATAEHIGNVHQRYEQDYKRLAARMETESREALKRNPSDGRANEALAKMAGWKNNRGESIDNYLAIARQEPENLAVLIRLGNMSRRIPQSAEVIKLLQSAVNHHPENAELQIGLADTLVWNDRYEEGEKVVREILRKNPRNVEAHKLLAMALTGQRKYAEGADAYREVVRLEPANEASHVMRIQALRDAKQPDAALAACREARQTVPRSRTIRRILAEMLKSRGDHAGAIAELTYLLATEEFKNTRAVIGLDLGQSLLANHQREEGMKVLKGVIQEDPDGTYGKIASNILQAQGVSENPQQKESPPAKAASVRANQPANPAKAADATSKPPSTPTKPAQTATIPPPTQNSTGIATAGDHETNATRLRLQGKREEAMTEYREALKLDPKLLKAHLGVGMLLIFDQKPAQAEAELRLAVAGLSEDAEANQWLAIALSNQQKINESLPYFRKAVTLAPTELNTQQNYLVALLTLNKTDDAIAAAKTAMAANNNNPWMRHYLARGHEQKGDNEGALREYRQSLADQKIKPFQAWLHLDYGKLLWKLGKQEEARKELQTTIELEPNSYGLQAKTLLEMWK